MSTCDADSREFTYCYSDSEQEEKTEGHHQLQNRLHRTGQDCCGEAGEERSDNSSQTGTRTESGGRYCCEGTEGEDCNAVMMVWEQWSAYEYFYEYGQCTRD